MISLPTLLALFPYTTLFRSHLRGLLRMRARADTEVDVRHRHAEVGEEHVGHGDVVVLAGVDELLLGELRARDGLHDRDRKSTRLNSSHANISYAVFCLKKKI